MTQPDLETCRDMFERAIELDAGYGPAWSCLAAAHATLYEWFGGREDDLARAERSSQKALELAPELALAHVARGFVRPSRRATRRLPGHLNRRFASTRTCSKRITTSREAVSRRATSSDPPTSSSRPRMSVTKTFRARCCWRSRFDAGARERSSGRGPRRVPPRREHARAEPARLPGALSRFAGALRRRSEGARD